MREDADRRLWIVQDIEKRQAERDDRRLVMFASPEIQMTIGICLHLAAAAERPFILNVGAATRIPQQEIEVR